MAIGTKKCSVPGCDRKVLARGWCNLHYLRWRAHGDALYERPAACSVEGCERPVEARGWCSAHYLRWRRHGTVSAEPLREPRLDHGDVCSVAGCEWPFYARGWCRKHYDRWQQAGDPMAPDRRVTFDPFSDEFWDQLDRSGGPNECWPWLRRRNRDGYGVITRDGRTLLAHRLAYALANGPIPRGMHVLHSCDNAPCCNPAHLLLGTRTENMADMKAKGRGRGGNLRGERNNAAKLSDAKVVEIRSRYPGETQTALAQAFGVHQSQISRIVAGERRISPSPALYSPADPITVAKLMLRDGWRCQICAEPIAPETVWPDPRMGTIDHRRALALGGKHAWSNVQAAHLDCNMRKSATVVDFC